MNFNSIKPEEAQRIFTLTKNVRALISDESGFRSVQQFICSRELGDSKVMTSFARIKKCQALLDEGSRALQEDELKDLLMTGIPVEERRKLTESLGGDRGISNQIINCILEDSINEIYLSSELKEFADTMCRIGKSG